MTSKVLKMPEQAAVLRDYQSAMDRVRQGISANIWNHGTHAERLAFAEDCLAARIEGTKQHDRTGRPQYVPDLYEENGGLQWGLTMSSRESLQTAGPQIGGKDRQGSRYEEAARRLGVSVEDDADFAASADKTLER